MVKDSHDDGRSTVTNSVDSFFVGRRSWLRVPGAAVVGGTAVTGTAGADHGDWHELIIEESNS